MDLRREYYNRMLDIFMSCYGNIIENASDGHCMKVTGFPLEVLPELRNKINSRETQAECYILSETLSGSEYITPTKLIELRNDLTKPILILIPVNSSTSAEDSYDLNNMKSSVFTLRSWNVAVCRKEFKCFGQ